MWIRHLRLALAAFGTFAGSVAAAPLCTLISDAHTHKVIYQAGECSRQVSPASTFKLALSLMGFDAGLLQSEHKPVFNYHAGDPDWGGANWLQPTDPERWIKYSVVWYSQRVTHALGQARLEQYARSLGFGNADLSGDPGRANGLDRAWISSSLKISPLEQLRFQEQWANGALPVSAQAMALTARISLLQERPEGWDIHGKTGTAYPRDAKGVSDETQGYGWFVGWAKKDNRLLAFAHLEQDEQAHSIPVGLRARDNFLAQWPRYAR